MGICFLRARAFTRRLNTHFIAIPSLFYKRHLGSTAKNGRSLAMCVGAEGYRHAAPIGAIPAPDLQDVIAVSFTSPSSKFMENCATEALRAGGKRRRRCALPAHSIRSSRQESPA